MATLTQTVSHPMSSSSRASSSSGFLLQPAPAVFDPEQGSFAFARVYDNVCLVQTDKLLSSTSQGASQPSTPLFLTPVEVAVFRHEFGTMFRYAHCTTVRASDIRILASISKEQVLCEDSGVVFVDRTLTNQLLQWTAPRRTSSPHTTRRRY